MNLRTAICPRKARKTRKVLFASVPRAALECQCRSGFVIVLAYRCRSGFVTPTETFQGLNRLRNVSDGVANPVTLRDLIALICPRKARKTRKVIGRNFRAQCRSGFVTPTETFQGLNRLQNVSDGVANPVTLSRFAKTTPPLPGIHERREKSLGEIFVLFVSFVDKKE